MDKIKIGLVGIGLNTYWKQFDGLLHRLTGYQNEIATELEDCGAQVVNAGLVDSMEGCKKALELLKTSAVDLLMIYVSTYALSSTILPLARDLKVPIVILNLQPVSAIDYDKINNMGDRGKMTGEWLAHCQACTVPELASVFNRSDIPYEIITGYMHQPEVSKEIKEWVSAAQAVKGMKQNRLGILGHYYCGMLDVYTDTTLQSSVFGTDVQLIEMCELKELRDKIQPHEVKEKREEFEREFDIDPACEEYELNRAARTSIALDKLVKRHKLGSMAYYYEGVNGNDYEDLITSVIVGNTLLTGHDVPLAGECEVKNAQAMKIMSLLGAGGSFAEPYAIDFDDDVVLWGHDGAAHFAIAQDRVKIVPLPVYHGKPGKGLSIQMTVKHGPVTLLSICEKKGKVFMLVAEGESVPGPVLQIGNTNSRYRFACGAKEFIDRWSKAGPSHHCAIGIGHVANKLEKMCFLLGIDIVRVS